MKMGEWEDAERDLLEALGKDAKDADTLANLVTVGLALRLLVAWLVGWLICLRFVLLATCKCP
jgi:hypothetical protein